MSAHGFADPRYYRSNEYALCRSLAKLGHEVTLFSSNRHPKWQMLEGRSTERSVEVVDGFTLKRFQSGPEVGTVPLMPTLLWHLLHTSVDILHAHTILAPASFYSAIASRAMRLPLVITQHDYMYGAVGGLKLFLHVFNNNTMGRYTMHRANAVIGLSSAAVSFTWKFGAAPSKTMFIPNSVDTNLFRPDQENLLKEKWGIEHQVVLFVGRLTKDKAPESVLQAFHHVSAILPDAKLVIVGKGPEEDSLKALQKRLDMRNIFFLGRVAKEDMPHIYAGADLFVLPSVYEPFGNVVLEAMSTGLPVVGSKIAGMSDVISHGVTGYHIRPGDTTGLSRHMLQLLKDDQLRGRMSKAARETSVERFDDMVIARDVETVYKSLRT